MANIPCPFKNCCNSKCLNFDQLYVHIKISHAGDHYNLTCRFPNCLRSFTTLKAFMQHIKSHETNQNTLSDTLLSSVRLSESESCDKNDNYSDNNSPSLLNKKNNLETDLCDTNKMIVSDKVKSLKNEKTLLNYKVKKKKKVEKYLRSYSKRILDKSIKLNINNKDKDTNDIFAETKNIPKAKEINEEVHYFADLLVAKMYATSNLPRKTAHSLLNDFQFFYKLNCFDKLKRHINKENIIALNILNLNENAFKNHKSDHMTLKQLKKHYYIEPHSKYIATVLKSKRVNRIRKFTQTKVVVEKIPIKKVLKHFLELPNVFDTIFNYIEKMEHCKCICSCIQTQRWAEIKKIYAGKIVFPYTLYGDDFEINNPLGSRKIINKINAIYCYISCIPPEYSGLLENILLTQLMKSEYKKITSSYKLYKPLLDEIKDLQENGIDLNVNGKEKKVYFELFNLSGDNLDLHAMLGFNQSFNSEFPCRLCLITKDNLKTATKLKSKTFRSNKMHSIDISKKTNSVKSDTIFRSIPNFNIFNHVSFDVLHDLFEGILRYEIADILYQLIYVDKCFSIELLNQRILNFNYSTNSSKNNCPPLNDNHLKTGKILMSGSEMKYLLFNLSLFIGDKVSSSNPAWKFYLVLRDMISFIMSPTFTKESIVELKKLITRHHKLYLKTFKNKLLKPKHHFLLHYLEMIETLGPPRNLSCIRCEGKHKISKDTAKSVTSRKNAPKTLAIKHQLALNYRFMISKGFVQRMEIGKKLFINVTLLKDYHMFKNIIKFNAGNYMPVSWVSVNGICYSNNSVLLLKKNGDSTAEFGRIVHVTINESSDIIFICSKLKTLEYSKHLCSYEISDQNTWITVSYKDLTSKIIFKIIKISDGKKYLSSEV